MRQASVSLRSGSKGFMKEMMPMKKMKCPNCGRRAFDISKLPKEQVEVNLKCPQCGKFVLVPCTPESEIKTDS